MFVFAGRCDYEVKLFNLFESEHRHKLQKNRDRELVLNILARIDFDLLKPLYSISGIIYF